MSFVAGTDWLLGQVRVFLVALFGGAGLACCWRLYSGLYRPRSRRRRDWLLPDLIFTVFAAALLAAYWFAFTDGGLLPQDFLWLACGFLLFRLLPPVRLPRLRPARRRRTRSRASRRAGAKKSRPDPLLRAVARWELKAWEEAIRMGRERRRRKNPGGTGEGSEADTEAEIQKEI